MYRFSFFFVTIILCCCQSPAPKSSHSLRIGIPSDPSTIDPRKLRDLSGVTFTHLFFEGLTRLDHTGTPQLAMAEKYTLSPDKKTYVFKLKKSFWSNGDPVTAHDFETTWKNNLNPASPSPNAYQLYVIQGAKEANEGTGSLDDISVKAIDDSTLIITLKEPTPYFLNLLATYFLYPVHSDDPTINNGPFQLKNWLKQNEILAVKNPLYWDATQVKLSDITFVVADDNTALRLFETGQLDWAGSPLGTIPADALSSLKRSNNFFITPSAATFFIRINTLDPDLQDIKTRQAFRDTLRRQELVEHVLQGNQAPAFSLVPFSFSKQPFEETQLTITVPVKPLTLIYAANERNHKVAQAIQDQWRVHLGVQVNVQALERKIFLDKVKNGDYQMSLGSWYADLADPISYLEVFKAKNNGTNNTGWENTSYQGLLNRSAKESDPARRKLILKKAERLLIQEAPIIPLFHCTYNYVRDPLITNAYFSELGYIDFKYADIIRP
jgi:oligopeptide transport system substrate-binding protein